MEFCIECTILKMKSRKRYMTEGMELPNQEYLKQTPSNKYRWKNKSKKVSQENMKTTRNQTVLQKPHKRNKHLGGIAQVFIKKLWQYIRPNIPEGTLTDNVSRKEGGRGLTSIENRFNATIQRLEDYIKSGEEDWLQSQETIQTTQG